MTRDRRGCPSGRRRRGRQGIVGFELHHRPDRDAHRGERFLEQRELREQVRVDAGAVLYPGQRWFRNDSMT